MNFLLLLSLILAALYFLLIAYYFYHWIKQPSTSEKNTGNTLALSVIVPVYNDYHKIVKFMEAFKAQDYKNNSLELIIVDDYSEVVPEDIILSLKQLDIAVKFIKNHYEKGKKQALRTGVEIAGNDWIIVSDADCIPVKTWLSEMAFEIKDKKPLLLSGPVIMNGDMTFFQNFQCLEFASLVGIGAASFLASSPIMCNGANMAFKKSLFLEAYDSLNLSLNTGDDIFLLSYAKVHYADRLFFVKSSKAIVSTFAEKNWKDFVRQRSRWASKSVYYKDVSMIGVACIVFLFSLLIVALLLCGMLNFNYFKTGIGLLMIKSVIDFIFLRSFLNFVNQRNLLWYFVPVQLIYPFYIVLAAFSGFLKSIKNYFYGR